MNQMIYLIPSTAVGTSVLTMCTFTWYEDTPGILINSDTSKSFTNDESLSLSTALSLETTLYSVQSCVMKYFKISEQNFRL